MTGLSPDIAVAYTIAHSDLGYCAEINGEPVAIFGIAGGVIWLVGTDEVRKHPVTLYRISKEFLREFQRHCPYLENYVDARNKLSLRWLKWLGFEIEPARCMGVENRPFHYVHKGR